MKLVIAQMKHETNTYSPVPTPLARFATGGSVPPEGDAVLAAVGCAWRPPGAAPVVFLKVGGSVPPALTGTWSTAWGIVTRPVTGAEPVVGDGRLLHHSELNLRHRTKPKYPPLARPLNLGDQRCLAVVAIDRTGRPTAVTVSGCPEIFYEPTRAALLKWRWGRIPEPGRTTVAVTYRID